MQENEILIYSDQKSSRLKYTLSLIFHDILKSSYQLSDNFEKFKKTSSAKIIYSELKDDNSISIRPSELLFEKKLSNQDLTMSHWEGLPVFFATDQNADFPNDIFAMIFYLVTRYEEYVDKENIDKHGRFRAEASLAFKNDFLQQPLVNQIAIKLQEKIVEQFPGFVFGKSKYKYIPTFDVDMAFSYLEKGFWRNTGGFIRSILKLEIKKIAERINVLSNKIPDPFNNFEFILDSLKSNGYEAIIFMNLGNYGRNDKNVAFNKLKFFRLLQLLNEKAQLNIHPSYASNSNTNLLRDEIAKLEHILGGEVIRSRQHFLILKWPQTYQNLIKHGIIEDYSLGYASQVGFRASICTPFKFYDLTKEKETNLLIRPFAFMDGTLTDYLKLSKDEILPLIKRMSDLVKEVGGDLIGIWHNSSLAEDVIIKDVYLNTLSILKE